MEDRLSVKTIWEKAISSLDDFFTSFNKKLSQKEVDKNDLGKKITEQREILSDFDRRSLIVQEDKTRNEERLKDIQTKIELLNNCKKSPYYFEIVFEKNGAIEKWFISDSCNEPDVKLVKYTKPTANQFLNAKAGQMMKDYGCVQSIFQKIEIINSKLQKFNYVDLSKDIYIENGTEIARPKLFSIATAAPEKNEKLLDKRKNVPIVETNIHDVESSSSYNNWLKKLKNPSRVHSEDISNIATAGKNKLGNIAAKISASQRDAMMSKIDGMTIIEGLPGSGKTNTILHRVEYILDNNSDIKENNIIIFCHNENLREYLDKSLSSFGIHNVKIDVFSRYISDKFESGKIFEQKLEDSITKESSQMITVLGEFIKERVKIFDDKLKKIMQIALDKDCGTLQIKDFHDCISYGSAVIGIYKDEGGEHSDSLSQIIIEYLKESFYIDSSIEGKTWKSGSFSVNKMLNDFYYWIGSEEKMKNWTNQVNFIGSNILNLSDILIENLYLELLLAGKPFQKELNYKHIIVDEAQNFSPLQLRLIYEMSNNKSITIAGDLSQSIAQDNIKRWEDIGINKFRIFKLKDSYRSTLEINQFAQSFYEDGHPLKLDANAFFRGERPIIFLKNNIDILFQNIIIRIKEIHNKNKDVSILVALKDHESISNFVKELRSLGISSRLINDNDNHEKVILADYKSVAGVEYDYVLVAGIDDKNIYKEKNWKKLTFALFYRARYGLNIFICGEMPEILNKIEKKYYSVMEIKKSNERDDQINFWQKIFDSNFFKNR